MLLSMSFVPRKFYAIQGREEGTGLWTDALETLCSNVF